MKKIKLVVNNEAKRNEREKFFIKRELQSILNLYAKMVSNGSWKDYGLAISTKKVTFSVFKNAAENAVYKICKTFKPINQNLKYSIIDSNGKIINNSASLENLILRTKWKKIK